MDILWCKYIFMMSTVVKHRDPWGDHSKCERDVEHKRCQGLQQELNNFFCSFLLFYFPYFSSFLNLVTIFFFAVCLHHLSLGLL